MIKEIILNIISNNGNLGFSYTNEKVLAHKEALEEIEKIFEEANVKFKFKNDVIATLYLNFNNSIESKLYINLEATNESFKEYIENTNILAQMDIISKEINDKSNNTKLEFEGFEFYEILSIAVDGNYKLKTTLHDINEAEFNKLYNYFGKEFFTFEKELVSTLISSVIVAEKDDKHIVDVVFYLKEYPSGYRDIQEVVITSSANEEIIMLATSYIPFQEALENLKSIFYTLITG